MEFRENGCRDRSVLVEKIAISFFLADMLSNMAKNGKRFMKINVIDKRKIAVYNDIYNKEENEAKNEVFV